RFLARDLEKSAPDPLVKRKVGRLEPAGPAVPAPRTSESRRRIEVVDESEIGSDDVAGDRISESHGVGIDAASGRLIGAGRVGVSVTEHEISPVERGANCLDDVLAAVGLQE